MCVFLFQKQPPTVPCIVGSTSCCLSVALPALRLGFQGQLNTLDLSCLSAGAGGVREQIHSLHDHPSQCNLSCLNSSCYDSVLLLAAAVWNKSQQCPGYSLSCVLSSVPHFSWASCKNVLLDGHWRWGFLIVAAAVKNCWTVSVSQSSVKLCFWEYIPLNPKKPLKTRNDQLL